VGLKLSVEAGKVLEEALNVDYEKIIFGILCGGTEGRA
jgi:hypothetical protein